MAWGPSLVDYEKKARTQQTGGPCGTMAKTMLKLGTCKNAGHEEETRALVAALARGQALMEAPRTMRLEARGSG